MTPNRSPETPQTRNAPVATAPTLTAIVKSIEQLQTNLGRDYQRVVDAGVSGGLHDQIRDQTRELTFTLSRSSADVQDHPDDHVNLWDGWVSAAIGPALETLAPLISEALGDDPGRCTYPVGDSGLTHTICVTEAECTMPGKVWTAGCD